MPRNSTLDYAKGMAIILMIIGHCYSFDNGILTLIYAFHMPFFFIVSGLIYGNKCLSYNANKFPFTLKKLVVHLLAPYFFYEILIAIFLSLLDRNNSFFTSMGAKLSATVTFNGIGATWFLACTFFVELLFLLLFKVHEKFAYIFSIALFLLALLIAPYATGQFVVLIRVLIGLGFFTCGFLVGKYCLIKSVNIPFSSFILLCILYIISSFYNTSVSLASLKLNNPFLYVINSIIGTILLLSFSKYITQKLSHNRITSILLSMGKNTLIILCTHMFLIQIIRLVDYKLFNDILKSFGLAEGIIFGLIVSGIEYLFIPYYNIFKSKIKTMTQQGAKV